MGIRKYKPTTPGRRGASVADFVEVTRSEPEKSLVRPLHSKGGRNAHGRVTARHQGGGHKRAYRVIDFRRDEGRRPGEGRAHRVRPQPHRPHRAAALRRRREALHHRADPPQPGRHGRVSGPCERHPARQRPAAAQHPDGHRGARHRAAARRRRQDRAQCRCQRPARRQGRALRAAAHAVRRDPQRRPALPRHGRRGRQRRAGGINWGKAGRMRWKGKRPPRPRRRHEPGRPPARRW